MTRENEILTLPPIDAETILAMIERLRAAMPRSLARAPQRKAVEDGRLRVSVGSTTVFEYQVVIAELESFVHDLGSAMARAEELAQDEALRCI